MIKLEKSIKETNNKILTSLNSDKLLLIFSIFTSLILLYLNLLSYIFNLSYCMYYSIPKEYVTFALHNNVIVLLLYYSIITLVMIFLWFMSWLLRVFFKNKLIYLAVSTTIIFILLFLLWMQYLTIKYDCKLKDIFLETLEIIKVKQFYYLIFVFLFFLFSISFFIVNMNLLLLPNSDAENHNKMIKTNNSEKKTNFKNKNRNTLDNSVVISIVLIIIFIVLFMYVVFFSGREMAKKQSEFWIVNNIDYKGEKLVKLYGENNNIIVLSPCTINKNNIIINNKYIIKKMDFDLELVKVKFSEVKLELNMNDDSNEDID